MIAQVVNQEFLLTMAEATRTEVELETAARSSGRRRRGPPGPLDEFETADLEELAAAFAAIPERREGLEDEPEPEAGGARARPRDDFAFVPRDPLLSIVQSVLEEYFEEQEHD